jgi:hypothetical protein
MSRDRHAPGHDWPRQRLDEGETEPLSQSDRAMSEMRPGAMKEPRGEKGRKRFRRHASDQ